MTLPLRHLPVLQQWDCHGCTNCCREYQVPVTEEERRRILSQDWDQDADLGDLPLFLRSGPPWRRRYRLNERGNGDCIFLSPQGRCRIHERFGADAKPLACRLFPFVLIPAEDHWRVSLRYACPSVAANRGRPLARHEAEVGRYAAELEARAGPKRPLPARLQAGQQVSWPDLLRFVQALQKLLADRRDRVERRLRKCLALARLCRQARFDKVQGGRLDEFLQLLTTAVEAETPRNPAEVPPPTWVGRTLFRQALALFLRKDHGPNRGAATYSRLSLFQAAVQFARGRGPVPPMHRGLPATTFEKVEEPAGPLPADAEEVLERYYLVKVGSLQFCGPTNFGLPFWDGLDALALTLPLVLWLARAYGGESRTEAVVRAIGVIDDHFGFNPVLGTYRQRYAQRMLARLGELEKLVAWYAR